MAIWPNLKSQWESSTVDLNRSQPERFQPEPYGLEDDPPASLGPDDEEPVWPRAWLFHS